MGSGWYAISLGPYLENDAISRMQSLKSQRVIPADSFLVEQSSYFQQFYPVGGNALNSGAMVAVSVEGEVIAPLFSALPPTG